MNFSETIKWKDSNYHIWLVVSTPLKNMKVSWDYYSQYMENKKCSKPPTRYTLIIIIYTNLLSPYPAFTFQIQISGAPQLWDVPPRFPRWGAESAEWSCWGKSLTLRRCEYVHNIYLYSYTALIHTKYLCTYVCIHIYIYMSVCNMSSWKCLYIYIRLRNLAHIDILWYTYIY